MFCIERLKEQSEKNAIRKEKRYIKLLNQQLKRNIKKAVRLGNKIAYIRTRDFKVQAMLAKLYTEYGFKTTCFSNTTLKVSWED